MSPSVGASMVIQAVLPSPRIAEIMVLTVHRHSGAES
jgi:hypothetical protein